MRRLHTFGALPIAVLLCLAVPAAATIYWTPAHELAPVGWGGPMTAGDLDGDGDIDLSLIKLSPPHQYWNVGTPSVPLWELDTSLFGDVPTCVHRDGDLADLDADGDLDLTVACSYDEFVRFYWNVGGPGSGTWVEDNSVYEGVPKSGGDGHPRLVDMDADGDLDLMLGSWSGRIRYARNNGTVTSPDFEYMGWVENIEYEGIGFPSFGLEDVDGDGDVDVTRVSQYTDPECFENIGTPEAFEFLENPDMLVGVECSGGAYGMELFDVDADGDPDLLLKSGWPNPDEFLVFLNQGELVPVEPMSWGLIKAMYR